MLGCSAATSAALSGSGGSATRPEPSRAGSPPGRAAPTADGPACVRGFGHRPITGRSVSVVTWCTRPLREGEYLDCMLNAECNRRAYE